MPLKKGTAAYKARLERRKAARRIKRLEKSMSEAGATARSREIARKQIAELQAGMEATRQFSNGKRKRDYTVKDVEAGMERLKRDIERVPQDYSLKGDPFEITQKQLNMASVNAPSIYTKKEASLFYKATEHIWHKENVSVHERNELILNDFNERREEKGLRPMTLGEIVEYVLGANKRVQEMQEINPQMVKDEWSRERYNESASADNEDGGYKSAAADVGAAAIASIRDALTKLYVTPNPTAFEGA